jgi:hypothetical protein
VDELVPIKRLRCQSNRCQPVGDEDMWAAMAFHCFPKEFQGCLAITALRNEAFQDFPFVIYSPPKIVRLTVDLHEHLVQMPLPAGPDSGPALPKQILRCCVVDGGRDDDDLVTRPPC